MTTTDTKSLVSGASTAPAHGGPDTLTTALSYAEQGIHVFPARVTFTDGKRDTRPIGSWRQASTVSPQTIRQWFGPGGSWEGAALCIDCGKSGLVVVDLDVKNGQDGRAEWAALEHAPTFRAFTPSGGEHHFYREDPSRVVGNDQSGKVARGVDVRGLGGFVFAPPTHDGRGAYRWAEGVPQWRELPIVPPVVADRMTRREPEPSSTPDAPVVPKQAAPDRVDLTRTPWTPDQAAREIGRALDKLSTAENGTRNGALNAAAMRLGHFVPHYLPQEQAVDLLTDRALAVGLDQEETRATVRSGLTAGMREPFPVQERGQEKAAPVVELPGPAVQAKEDRVARLRAMLLDPDALEARPRPEPLVAGLLHMASLAWIIGAPGSFKSFVALDIAAHVGTGAAWQGKDTKRGRVLYLAAEGSAGMALRLKAWREHYGTTPDLLTLPQAVQAGNDAEWDALVEVAKELEPVLIVVDTQARVTVGMEENSNTEMGRFVEKLEQLKRATGACVLTVHHTGRNGEDARGASALDGAQDTELKVTRPKDRADLSATLRVEKQKDGEDGHKMPLRLRRVAVGLDDAGTLMDSLVVEERDPFAESAALDVRPAWEKDLTGVKLEIMQVMREHSGAAGATFAELDRWVNERRKERSSDIPLLVKSTRSTAVKSLCGESEDGQAAILARDGKSRVILPEYVVEEDE